MMLWEKIESDPALSFDITTTLDDHLAYNRYIENLPDRRRRLYNRLVGYGILLPLVALVACFALLFVLYGTACDLEDALGESARGRIYAIILASLASGHALAWLAFWLWRRANLADTLRAHLTRRVGVDPADPTLAERTNVTLHASGFRVTTDSAAYAGAWTTTRRFDEVAAFFFIMAETNFGFIIPKRELPPATILALRDMMLAFQTARRA